jgi:O-antigen biosynthesis protein
MKFVRVLGTLLLFLISPLLLVFSALALALVDVLFGVLGSRRTPSSSTGRNWSASVVIPNWNGRDLLEKYLPGVIDALSEHADNEVIVVDNASSDGSAEFLSAFFPSVRVIRSGKNLGFGGGSNLGVREARNDIVVLLNSDMRVAPDFLAPLLEPFTDPLVFSVSSQIFFSDPSRRREETGLTQGWWEEGRLRLSHRIDDEITRSFPCFYGGGGSSAYDRQKFLELGGFDEILRPFYYEDTDLGYMAWKRGWKVLYQPRSIVYHEHRGTIGRRFSQSYVQSVLKKNVILFTWKNIHSWRLLSGHFLWCLLSSFRSFLFGDAPGSYSFPGLAKAFLQLASVCKARWHAKSLSAVSDREALVRPLGSYFRDRFEIESEHLPTRLRVLFAAPYPIEPPVHGGAVFMKMTLEELGRLADVHLVGMVDRAEDLSLHETLAPVCASMRFIVRKPPPRRNLSTSKPHAVREFADEEFAWILHRTVLQENIDAIQLEYLQFAQYAGEYHRLPCFLFEHDLYFQSVGRLLNGDLTLSKRIHYSYEYLRALQYELTTLPKFTRVQVCSQENAKFLLEFAPRLSSSIDSGVRAGIQATRYAFIIEGREADTMLFVGSFRHEPNVNALRWFVTEVLPRVTALRPSAILVIVGSDPPPSMAFLSEHPSVRFTGHVEDIRAPLGRFACFVCPILSGSGIRVKLLEAFASGIPAISTSIGAEGLASETGTICEIANAPDDFAGAVVRILSDRQYAAEMALRARRHVESEMDGFALTAKLEKIYRRETEARRSSSMASIEIQRDAVTTSAGTSPRPGPSL